MLCALLGSSLAARLGRFCSVCPDPAQTLSVNKTRNQGSSSFAQIAQCTS